MKILNLKTLLLTLCTSITMLSASEAPQNQGYFSRLYSNIKHWFERTPFSPGWNTTPEQKEKAREKLVELLFNKDTLETELAENTDLTDEQIKEKQDQIATLEKNIHEQKVILGKKWSNRRKLVTGTAAAGLSAYGLTTLHSFSKPHKITLATPKQQIAVTIANDVAFAQLPKLKFKKNVEYKWSYYNSRTPFKQTYTPTFSNKGPSTLEWVDSTVPHSLYSHFLLCVKKPHEHTWMWIYSFSPYDQKKNFEINEQNKSIYCN